MAVLHLIPCPIAEDALHTLPNYLLPIIESTKIWCVEDLRSARRFLKKVNKNIDIDSLELFVVNEHEDKALTNLETYLQEDKVIGLLSEAGCPAVADPGSKLVALAHLFKATVVPHIGPNSILLTLMGSGFNGQQFKFNGYLPVKQPELSLAIKKLAQESNICTQLFIEAPYRNKQLLEALCSFAPLNNLLCIGFNLTMPNQFIKTETVGYWKKNIPDFHKQPAVFALGA